MKAAKRLVSSFTRRVQSHPGQSFVEFALALPILLMLVFGIIEFGRMMQAWLALENGARFAVRYAVTGSYDPQYCAEAGAALGLASDDLADGNADCNVPSTVADSETKTSQLQDWARLPSIRNAAMSGAMGIALDTDESVSGDYPMYLDNAYDTGSRSSSYRGDPSQAGYFSVSTCSNRVLPPEGDSYRFNPNPFYMDGHSGNNSYQYPIYCELVTHDGSGSIRFVDDAGGPGDRVRVVLTYRHTLITPFLSSWWPTLRLTSEREGIVEKFRNSRITGLSGAIAFAATWTHTPMPPTITPTVTQTPLPVTCPNTGSVLHEWWNDVTGSAVSDLTVNGRYPYEPSGHDNLSIFEGPSNSADNYGARYQAYLCPPYTGTYTFWIAANDTSELWLSNSQDPGSAAKIASATNWTNSREWYKYSSQQSVSINLVAGQLYYIQALHKDSSGGDNLAVAWAGPGISSSPTVIIGQYLVPVTTSYIPTRTATATLAPSCDMAQFDTNEGLLVDDNNIYVPIVDNSSQYDIVLTGSSGQWLTDWHDFTRSQDVVNVLKEYGWWHYGYARFYALPSAQYVTFNTPVVTWNHNFGTTKIVPDYTSYNFFSVHFQSNWPRVVPSFSVTDPFCFYHGSDFTVTVRYNVGSLSCQQTVTGLPGPVLNPTINTGTAGAFSVNANATAVRGVRRVIFNVYDQSGTLVHTQTDTTAAYCLFGGNNSTCNTKRPYVDTWSTGTLITNGTYTVSIIAEDNSTYQAYYATRRNITVVVNIATPTATRTSAPTNTRTITRTPTVTKTPTITPTPSKTGTKTASPTITQTPTRTLTRTITRTPTITNTQLPTATATRCLTPIEMGGCQ